MQLDCWQSSSAKARDDIAGVLLTWDKRPVNAPLRQRASSRSDQTVTAAPLSEQRDRSFGSG
jgi:hypothetical protein